MRVLKSGYTCGGPEQGFRRYFAEGLDESLVPSVAQAKGDGYHVKSGQSDAESRAGTA